METHSVAPPFARSPVDELRRGRRKEVSDLDNALISMRIGQVVKFFYQMVGQERRQPVNT
jgi:hypothetical protein